MLAVTKTLLAHIRNRSIMVATRDKKCYMTFSVHRKVIGLVSSRLSLSVSHQPVGQRKELPETNHHSYLDSTITTNKLKRFSYIWRKHSLLSFRTKNNN